MLDTSFLWKPLFEAAAQTVVGAIGGYALTQFLKRATEKNTFDGAMDLWRRGIHENVVGDGDQVVFDGLISPFTQLFPGDPMENAVRWNQLYSFQGTISSEEYQAMEFVAGSDAALRVGSLNGETIVGLYSRYGFVGEGLIGVIPTKIIRKAIPDFFHPSFFGKRARVYGRLSLCPAQHGFVVQQIASKSGININTSSYANIYYLQISKVVLLTRPSQRTCTLLGSAWAATEKVNEQYLVQYGYMSEKSEITACNRSLFESKAWKKAKVFYDDITAPSESLEFKRNFIL